MSLPRGPQGILVFLSKTRDENLLEVIGGYLAEIPSLVNFSYPTFPLIFFPNFFLDIVPDLEYWGLRGIRKKKLLNFGELGLQCCEITAQVEGRFFGNESESAPLRLEVIQIG